MNGKIKDDQVHDIGLKKDCAQCSCDATANYGY